MWTLTGCSTECLPLARREVPGYAATVPRCSLLGLELVLKILCLKLQPHRHDVLRKKLARGRNENTRVGTQASFYLWSHPFNRLPPFNLTFFLFETIWKSFSKLKLKEEVWCTQRGKVLQRKQPGLALGGARWCEQTRWRETTSRSLLGKMFIVTMFCVEKIARKSNLIDTRKTPVYDKWWNLSNDGRLRCYARCNDLPTGSKCFTIF